MTFRLPRSQADQLEHLLGALPVNQVGVLYFSIQNAITSQANADLAAQRDAFSKEVIEQHEKSKTAPIPPKE